MARPGRPMGTSVQVLLAHGLRHEIVALLAARLPDLERVAATLQRHRDDSCGGPDACPWHRPGGLADVVDETTTAMDAWCAVGWMQRDLLGPHTLRDRRIARDEQR